MARKSITLVTLFFIFPIILYSTPTKTYKIACDENYYPYINKNEETGELTGIIIDWWNLWAEKVDANVEFIPLDLGECIEKTNQGETDAIAALFYSDERSKLLDFTEPLVRMRTVVFFKKDIKVNEFSETKETIGVLKNDLAFSFLQDRYPEIKLKVFEDFGSLQNEVQNEFISAFVYDIPNSLRNYKEVDAPNGYKIHETLYSGKLRAAVKPGNSELLNLIIAGSAKMSDDEVLAIAEQWNLFQPNHSLLWILLITGLVLGVVIALFVSHFYRSKRKIKEMEDFASKTDWKLIIDKGENDRIEFKSSLRWDYRQDKINKALEKVIVKTISAFLNTDGGMLFIGVDDDGNILGLDNDYSSFSKNNSDGFLLALTTLINMNLGKSSHKFLSVNIISINERDVCIVNVEPSDKPVFLGSNDKEEFYIRASASSQPLGLSETFKYINSNWKKG